MEPTSVLPEHGDVLDRTPGTAGDGFVYGSSVATQIGSVRKKIGVCPQFDILWGELTGEEQVVVVTREIHQIMDECSRTRGCESVNRSTAR